MQCFGEGKEERSKCITPIIQELKKYYDYEDKALMEKGVNVLSIGCRFGRILYELAKLGYTVEGNERSYLFLLVANYLFNYSKKMEIAFVQEYALFVVALLKKV